MAAIRSVLDRDAPKRHGLIVDEKEILEVAPQHSKSEHVGQEPLFQV